MMSKDSIIDEIHKHREAYAAKFNFDMRRIYEDAKKRQEASGRNTVSLKPRPVQKFLGDSDDEQAVRAGNG